MVYTREIRDLVTKLKELQSISSYDVHFELERLLHANRLISEGRKVARDVEARIRHHKELAAKHTRLRAALEDAKTIGDVEACKRHQVPIDLLETTRKIQISKNRNADINERWLTVMRLAERGWPNKRIAEKTGYSASYVSKIIRRSLRDDRVHAYPYERLTRY